MGVWCYVELFGVYLCVRACVCVCVCTSQGIPQCLLIIDVRKL